MMKRKGSFDLLHVNGSMNYSRLLQHADPCQLTSLAREPTEYQANERNHLSKPDT